MKTEKIVVSDLFEKPRRYLVPIFQRGYVWTENEQWSPLWEDITNLVEAIRIQREGNVKHLRKHFLGALVLQQQSMGVRHTPVSDVIDGQQRLITLQIILIALRDTVANLNNDFLNATLARLTKNPAPYLDENECYKVWPTSVYREDFAKLASATTSDVVEKCFPRKKEKRKYLPRPQLVEAYLFYCNKIKEYLSTETDQEKIICLAENLLEAITRNMQLVEINLDIEDDPQIIFETLNARGAPLTASDLIRNYVFLYASRKQDDVVHLYENYWKSFDETPDINPRSKTRRFWKEEERQGRFKTNRLDLFFYHYLTCNTHSDSKIGHIFQEFKDWWDNGAEQRDTKTELFHISTASETYKKLLTLNNGSSFGRFSRILRTLDTSTIYPLILYLESKRADSNGDVIDGIYSDIESYLLRRIICFLTPKNYNNVFLSMLQRLKAEPDLTREAAQNYLLALDGDTVLWPDDEMFKINFIKNPLYSKLRSQRVQLILESIEKGLSAHFQESIRLDSTLSIEHIWPQSPSQDEWPPFVEKKEDGSIDWVKYYKLHETINSIGNLTLVTQSFNSSLSNRSFAIKQPAIIRESRLRLNAYFQDVDGESWTESEIFKRGETLFEVAVKVWPRPRSVQEH